MLEPQRLAMTTLALVCQAVSHSALNHQRLPLIVHDSTEVPFPAIEPLPEKFNSPASSELLAAVSSLAGMFRDARISPTDEITPPFMPQTEKHLDILGLDPTQSVNTFVLTNRLAARLSAEHTDQPLATHLLTLLDLTHSEPFPDSDNSQSTADSSECPSPVASRRRTFSRASTFSTATSSFFRPPSRLSRQLELSRCQPVTSLSQPDSPPQGSLTLVAPSRASDEVNAKAALKHLMPQKRAATLPGRGFRARVMSLWSAENPGSAPSGKPRQSSFSEPRIAISCAENTRNESQERTTLTRGLAPPQRRVTSPTDQRPKNPKLDPGLAALEKACRLRSPVNCCVCGCAGSDFSRCPRCLEAWCSRECRLQGLQRSGGGKRHVCSSSKPFGATAASTHAFPVV